jgi:hypothetical protein
MVGINKICICGNRLFFSPIVRVGGFTISFMISPAACIEAFVPKGRRRKTEEEGKKEKEGERKRKEAGE